MALARSLFAFLRRLSEVFRSAVAVVLLTLVYVALLPWFALGFRLRRGRPSGWIARNDPEVGTLARLRSRF